MTCTCGQGGKHPHTVPVSGVPLYLRGVSLLGQEDAGSTDYMMDPSISDPMSFSMPAPINPTISFPDMVPPAIDPNYLPGGTAMTFSSDPNQPLIDSGFSPSDAATISDLAAKGWINQSDWNDLMSGNVTATELAKINYDAAQAQDAAIAASVLKAGVATSTAVVKAATPSGTQKVSLPAGSSPRVAVPPAVNPAAPSSVTSWFSGSTAIGSTEIPNVLLIGAPVLIALMFMGGGSRRKR